MDLKTARDRAKSAGTAGRKKFDKALRIIPVVLVVIAMFYIPYGKFISWMSPSNPVATTTPSVSKPVVTTEVVYPRNTDRNCTGELSSLQPLTTEVLFNPKGCYFYALGKGTVKFAGLFSGTYDVDLETGRGSKDGMKVYTARSAGGPVLWQYILCSGPKQNSKTLDCT